MKRNRKINSTLKHNLGVMLGFILILNLTSSWAEQLPPWVLSPPGDNNLYFYGVGEGNSRDHATKKALAEIGGKLGTSVKSDLSIQKTLKNNQEALALRENIDASVKKIEFSNFEVENVAKVSGKAYVLVKLDRSAMASRLKNDLEQARQTLNDDFSRYKQYSNLKKSQAVADLRKKIDKVRLDAVIARSLTPSYAPNSMLTDLNKMENAFTKNQDNLEILVERDKNTEAFARKLEELLTQQGVKVAAGGPRSGKTVINIKGDTEDQQFEIEHWTKLIVSIHVYDERGNMLKTYAMNESGAGLSKKAALGQANVKLYKKFVSKNMLEDLGF